MEAAEINPEKVYRIARRQIGGYLYSVDYDEKRFIHVRILNGPDEGGFFDVTTRGEDGRHLGPGGGWHGDSTLTLHASDLEKIGED